jgi:hypothetical protein
MFEVTVTSDPAGFLVAVSDQLAKLPAELWRSGNDAFAAIASALDDVATRVECTRVALVDEAEARGVVAESSATSPAHWLMLHSAHLEPADASRTADLARDLRQPANQTLSAAVAGGTVTIRKAATVLRQLRQVEHRLDPLKREQALSSLTTMAQEGYDSQVRCVGRRLMALAGADRALEKDEAALRRLGSLRLVPMDNGMTRIHGQLDPESATVVAAALDPLTAPRPSAEGAPDLRPAEQRRAEALVEICHRAAAAGGEAPTTTKAQVVVSIDYDTLVDGVRGSGLTLAGEVLSPETIRKVACDATLIPVVLGGKGEVLDVGRLRRLVTPRLLAALWVRDKGCSFPGCSRPPHWCHAHHVHHWARGGGTDLRNLALLCERHHTHVHAHDLSAEVTASGVVWSVQPRAA